MWIESYRLRHGMSLEEFGRLVRWLGNQRRPGWRLRCSDSLIWLLENRRNAVTHPNIADLLAEACGATPKQRDMIVARKHRCTWAGSKGPDIAKLVGWKADKGATKKIFKGRDYGWHYASKAKYMRYKPVVMVDKGANVVSRYDSMEQAAEMSGCSRNAVSDRCNHLIRDEFRLNGHTWRFVDEWEKQTPEERLRSFGRVRHLYMEG